MSWQQNRRPASEYLNRHKAQRILTAHAGICHLCGHPDAEQVDHLVPWSQWTRTDISVHDPTNLAPAHGAPCPTCRRQCHEEKTREEAAAGRAKAYAQRAQQAKRPLEKHPGAL